MISSNTRATRSRFSSPAQPNLEKTKEAPKSLEASSSLPGPDLGVSKTFMQKWLEPGIQSKPSFEEAGLARFGVVEGMAPLGSMPKPKKDQVGNHGVRKIILKTSNYNANSAKDNSTIDAKMSTTKPLQISPPPPLNLSESLLADPFSPGGRASRKSLPAKMVEDDDDDDYNPIQGTRRRQSARASLPKRGRPPQSARRDSIISEQTSPVKRAPSPHVPSPPAALNELQVHGTDFVDNVVRVAVEEALSLHRYPTAFALRELYDENSTDTDFLIMLEKVFSQTADAPMVLEFSRLIERKKREGKKDNNAVYYFLAPETKPPHPPMPAPYSHMLRHRMAQENEEDDDEPRLTKKIKISHNHQPPEAQTPRKTTNGSARTPGSRRRQRRDSASSESSLSSVMSLSSIASSPGARAAVAHDDNLLMSPSFRGAGATEAAQQDRGPHATSNGGPKPRPIKTRGKSLASNKEQPTDAVSPAHTPTAHQPPISALLFDEEDVGLVRGRMSGRGLSSLTGALPKKLVPANIGDDFWTKRMDMKNITDAYNPEQSWIRDSTERDTTPARAGRIARQAGLASVNTRATRSGKKQTVDDGEALESPAAFSFQGDGSSVMGSRAVTPTNLRPTKKQKTGLRIKLSPVKKKGGTAAGLPRGEAQLPSANGVRDQNADNEEFCSSCGNAGDVVCCDGCPRSFHFECIDMQRSDDDLPDEWYCNTCLGKWFASRLPVHQGVFGNALNALERMNPRAFSLPKKLQSRFEGIKAGADGDFEDIVSVIKGVKKKNGYEEAPDLHKQWEDGEAVLCHECQKSANDAQAIIPCSVCPLQWHLDCMNPPLANPPLLKTWRCPAHVDELLLGVPNLAPAHRYRKLKGAPAISPAFARGLKNNGHIDIDWADEPIEFNRSGWTDPTSFGRIHKLPVKGVILDVIEQLRNQTAGYGKRSEEPRWVTHLGAPKPQEPYQPLAGSAYDRQLHEMQLALNVMSLKQTPTDGIEQLTAALLESADDDTLALMAKGNVDNFARRQLQTADKTSLRAMLAQVEALGSSIRNILAEEPPGRMPATLTPQGTATPDPESKSSMGKMEQDLPVTEPTPPSTVDNVDGEMDSYVRNPYHVGW